MRKIHIKKFSTCSIIIATMLSIVFAVVSILGMQTFRELKSTTNQYLVCEDTYGHAVGDEIIKKVAHQLKSSFRSTDYIFRIGGDEFAIIMVDVSSRLRPMVEAKLWIL